MAGICLGFPDSTVTRIRQKPSRCISHLEGFAIAQVSNFWPGQVNDSTRYMLPSCSRVVQRAQRCYNDQDAYAPFFGDDQVLDPAAWAVTPEGKR
jgi:hypothetical protein